MTATPTNCTRCCRRSTAMRDARRGEPLRRTAGVHRRARSRLVDEDIEQLYDDQFIETCAEWVVPYIGDLIGVRGAARRVAGIALSRARVRRQHDRLPAPQGHRGGARAAGARRHRLAGAGRRVLRAARDDAVHEPPARCRHRHAAATWRSPTSATRRRSRRSARRSTRRAHGRRAPHRAAARPLQHPERRHLPVRLWTTRSPMRRRSRSIRGATCSTRSGKNVQLFSDPVPEDEITHLAEPVNVPVPLTAGASLDRRTRGRSSTASARVCRQRSTAARPAPADPHLRSVRRRSAGWAHTTGAKIAIDPVLGRIALAAAASPPRDVRVSYRLRLQRRHRRRRLRARRHRSRVTIRRSRARGATARRRSTRSRSRAAPSRSRTATIRGPLSIAAGTARAGDRAARRTAAAPDRRARGRTDDHGRRRRRSHAQRAADQRRIRVPRSTSAARRTGCVCCGCGTARSRPGSRPPMLGLRRAAPGPQPDRRAPGHRVEIEHCIVGGLRVVEDAHVRSSAASSTPTARARVAYAGCPMTLPGAPLEVSTSTVIGKAAHA